MTKLVDAEKIYIPVVGDNAQINSIGGQDASVLGSATSASTGLINLNTATEQDLDNLPSVGTITAQKIISARLFASLDDLVSRKVITKKVIDKIKDQRW